MGSVRIFQVYRLHNFRSAVLLAPLANNCLSFHSNTECKQSRGMSKSVGFAPFVWNIESSNRLTTKCHAVSSSRFYATSHNRTGSGGKTLYDALEVSPTANQLQIKEAYFRLSKVYHPDVNKSKDAAVKFNEISQAYEILGKPTTRRVYDKGILKANDPRSTRTGFRRAATDHQQAGFEYKDTHDTQTKRSTRQQYTGRTPIYDYDEWLRSRSDKGTGYGNSPRSEEEEQSESPEHSIRMILYTVRAVVISIIMTVLVIEFYFKGMIERRQKEMNYAIRKTVLYPTDYKNKETTVPDSIKEDKKNKS